MSLKRNIGYNVLRFRKSQELSQQQIADYLGVTREFISLVESGDRALSISKLNKLADLFGIELEVLLEDDEVISEANLAFAFRTTETAVDLNSIAMFRKIVMNYLKMENIKNEIKN